MDSQKDTLEDANDDPHSKALCILTYNVLAKNHPKLFIRSPFESLSSEDIREAVEDVANEVLRFFREADSADPKWYFPLRETNSERPPLFGSSETDHAALYNITFDKRENEATDAANRGDFRELECLLLERGYLRSQKARELMVERSRTNERSRRRPGTASKEQAKIFHEVLDIMHKQLCSENKALNILAETMDAVADDVLSENTLKDRWKKTKADPSLSFKLAMAESFVDTQRKNNGKKPIPSRYPRGMERMKIIAEENGWVGF